MTNTEKIKRLEKVLGNNSSWVIQAKWYEDTEIFNAVFRAMVQSTLASLETEKNEIENKIKILEETLDF